MMRSPVRALAVTAALVAAALAGTATPAAADHPSVAQPFRAESGDNCRYGIAQGTLEWAAIHPPELPSVAVSGFIIDQPVPITPTQSCPDDRRFTTATFQAFSGNRVVDTEAPMVDNAGMPVSFRLAPSATPFPVPRIDRVVVTVCRHSTVAPGGTYCGVPQTYFPINA